MIYFNSVIIYPQIFSSITSNPAVNENARTISGRHTLSGRIGKFLKELRKPKGLTQEQIAEKFHVSNRTISRWENGNNMPDLDILIELSDYYEVDLREILNGERKSRNMDKEMKETVLRAADYTNTEAEHYNRRVRICNGIALLFVLAYTQGLGHSNIGL